MNKKYQTVGGYLVTLDEFREITVHHTDENEFLFIFENKHNKEPYQQLLLSHEATRELKRILAQFKDV